MWKDFLVGFLSLPPKLGIICVNKNVHIATQHPLLESMIAELTCTSEISESIPRFGQELSICICFNRVKIDDLTHPDREGCSITNSLILVILGGKYFCFRCTRYHKFYGQDADHFTSYLYMHEIFQLRAWLSGDCVFYWYIHGLSLYA